MAIKNNHQNFMLKS